MPVNPAQPTTKPQRIAVFRALQLGDILCAIPALRALRAWAPRSHVTLIGLPWAAELVPRFRRYVDDFVPFPGFPGFPERDAAIEAFFGFLHAMRRREFDLVLQLHGSGRFSNPLVALFAAKQYVGFGMGGERVGDAFTVVPWPEEGPELMRLLTLTEALGARTQGTGLELPLTREDWAEWEALAACAALYRRPYVCIHPGARLASRRWPLDRFAEVGRVLADDGWRVVVTGAASERDLTGELARRIGGDAICVAGLTTLGSLGALFARSTLLVANDTGVSHVAAALRAPSVIVASGSDVNRWAPLDRERHRVLWHDVACRPCACDACPVEGHPCAMGVGVDAVVANARDLLKRRLRHAA